ncbi:hypothetical protein O181_028322 [Austropuccinia psidii MF-1]|uniref:Adenine DNA glycosylase n=1 Tax=Austropuccinia psidii MF-1 TaxID=1389203 RepID=A0A9Q3H2H0_9BASI|nr:hypothetical protein [Austropuccinia psidii MF-1]
MSGRPRRSTRLAVETYAEVSDSESRVGAPRKKKELCASKSRFAKSACNDSSSLSDLSDYQDRPPSQKLHRTHLITNESASQSLFQAVDSSQPLHPFSYHTSHLIPSPCRSSTDVNAPLKSRPSEIGDVPKIGLPSPELVLFQKSLLEWYDQVKRNRDMPWRKEPNKAEILTNQQKGQRAYEVWVSEIMLQQTQVETVKSYYLRWMSTFPTIFDLAKANIEQVNQCWQGLGYYSRASRLLSGAQKVVNKFDGILPDDPSIMEKEVDGIGPYSAGAIASIAFEKPVPMIDGNVHRVLARLTALYSPQAAKATTKFLWSVASNLVPEQRPGDFNQALMELGATICKPREARCPSCPLAKWCRAFEEHQVLCSSDKPNLGLKTIDIEDACDLCHPFTPLQSIFTSTDKHVLRYPMAKERKKPVPREVAVGVVQWQPVTPKNEDPIHRPLTEPESMVLLIKRPQKGLLAGLWEFPSVDLSQSNDSTKRSRLAQIDTLLHETLTSSFPPLTTLSLTNHNASIPNEPDIKVKELQQDLPDIQHIFSHMKVTYKPIKITLCSTELPRLNHQDSNTKAIQSHHVKWIPSSLVMTSNIGNPHKKVWKSLVNISYASALKYNKRKFD